MLNQPELRTTPGGTALLRVVVECGDEGRTLALAVVMMGEQARQAAHRLRCGQEIKVSGELRSVAQSDTVGGLRTRHVEVLANEIKPAGN